MTSQSIPSPPNGKLFAWLRFAATVSSLCIVPLIIWGVSIEVRLTAIEATRYTSEDAAELLQFLNAHLVQQSASNATSEMRDESMTREMSNLYQAIRDAVDKMDRYHSNPVNNAGGYDF